MSLTASHHVDSFDGIGGDINEWDFFFNIVKSVNHCFPDDQCTMNATKSCMSKSHSKCKTDQRTLT